MSNAAPENSAVFDYDHTYLVMVERRPDGGLDSTRHDSLAEYLDEQGLSIADVRLGDWVPMLPDFEPAGGSTRGIWSADWKTHLGWEQPRINFAAVS